MAKARTTHYILYMPRRSYPSPLHMRKEKRSTHHYHSSHVKGTHHVSSQENRDATAGPIDWPIRQRRRGGATLAGVAIPRGAGPAPSGGKQGPMCRILLWMHCGYFIFKLSLLLSVVIGENVNQ
jgi:hypothetical protein